MVTIAQLQAQKKRISNDWPEPAIYSMELDQFRNEPDWGDFVEG